MNVIDSAAAYLLGQLENGPMLSSVLMKRARAEGYSSSSIKRAQARLGCIKRSKKGKGGWWTELPPKRVPRVRASRGGAETVSMNTSLDLACMEGHEFVEQFQEWHDGALTTDMGRGPLFNPARCAAILGFIATTGSITGAALFGGISHAALRRWLVVGQTEQNERLAEAKEGRMLDPTPHEKFLVSYWLARGFLFGHLASVVNKAALNGDVGAAQWSLRSFHGVTQRVELDLDPPASADQEDAREQMLARIEEIRARRKAREAGPDDSE